MAESTLKRALKASPMAKAAARFLVLEPLRAYFRHGPPLAKLYLWENLASIHLRWLESAATVGTEFGSKIALDTREFMGRYIYFFGVWEPNLTAWMQQRLVPGDVFVDVGANIGYYSLLASRLVGDSGKVIAVEAHPEIFLVLAGNLKINGATNVRAIHGVAWDCEAEIPVYADPDVPSGHTTVMQDWASRWQFKHQVQVHAAPLSVLLQDEEASAARLIKIDVEGAEWHVLSGMWPLIDNCRRDLEIVVEVSPQMLEGEGRTLQDMLDCFNVRGFHAYCIENDYSAKSYLTRNQARRPSRMRETPTTSEQSDIIFSRIDADSL